MAITKNIVDMMGGVITLQSQLGKGTRFEVVLDFKICEKRRRQHPPSALPGEYDAILMDVQMPGMDGYEATRTIRSGANPLGRTIPIIAMTANAFAEDVKKSLDAGMNAHLSKPVDLNALEQTLQRFRYEPSAEQPQ